MIPPLSSSALIPISVLDTSHTSNNIPLRAMPSIIRHAIQSLSGTSNSDWPLIRESQPRYQNDSRESYVSGDRGMREGSRVNEWVDTQDRGQQARHSNDRQAPSTRSIAEPRVGILGSRRISGRERLLDLANLRRPSRPSRASNAPENSSTLRGLAAQSLSRYMDQRNKPQANSSTSQQRRGREFDFENEELSDVEQQDQNDPRQAERRHQESYSADRNGYETGPYSQQERCYEMR
ncbi:hypothetical protein GLAREA_01582 [Glarea lozoyensis ATCC 20868]|uniref:Uncharacterized protein n=1 Tax=Glarea lozoyensis (strain ATCC 20868 / MF5171) TaxID=1116229 RepID=S3CIK7_GLAL2|nr:uncharacterized protein GLAREA_01582 [Glarea lozoyensis ATCC 20868]EPE25670.1 hypothetical protein GLAREA_01582 [Glarea lozoyensis ATCC 20868]